MKKIKLVLNESLVTNINTNQVDLIEDVSVQQKPDYQIIDITVIPDEEYNPTIQSILIDLDESSRLCESVDESKNLSINILSETVNIKTGYSNSLFEFENKNHTITLSLVLQETEKRGIYKVEAYTTKGEKVFESNTCKPRKLIESYLNSLAVEYLIDRPLKESEQDDMEWLKDTGYEDELEEMIKNFKPSGDIEKDTLRLVNRASNYFYDIVGIHNDNVERAYYTWAEEKAKQLNETEDKKLHKLNESNLKEDAIDNARADTAMGGVAYDDYMTNFRQDNSDENEDPIKDDVKRDLNIEPGSDEESMLDDLYYDDEEIEEEKDYSVEEFMQANKLTDEVKNLNIDYSEWNNMNQEERDKLVTPELNRFYNKYKVEFDKNPKLFELLQYNLTDDNFHTEAKILRDLRGGE